MMDMLRPAGSAALAVLALILVVAAAENSSLPTVRDFGAIGDGTADDTEAFERAVREADGVLRLPPGRYRLTETVEIDLDRAGPFSITGEGGATVIMAGPGPAFRLVGTHGGTALPSTVEERVWLRQRAPTLDNFEIVGAHPQALGIEIRGAMQPILTRLLIRKTLHGVRLTGRNRNVIISACHIYENRGAGILMERVNLHQINIVGSHISYNGGGGIVARESEIRNLQIGSCDIESNMDPEGPPTANVLIDVRRGSVREGAIIGSTLQHNHESPGSANIRLVGNAEEPLKAGYFSIANNALSDVRINVHLKNVRGVSITGNSFWKGFEHDLLVEGSSNIVVGPNLFDRSPDYRPADSRNGILFSDSRDSTLSGLHLNGSLAEGAALVIRNCRRIHVSGLTALNFRGAAVWIDGGEQVRVFGSFLDGSEAEETCVRVTGGAKHSVADNLCAAETR